MCFRAGNTFTTFKYSLMDEVPKGDDKNPTPHNSEKECSHTSAKTVSSDPKEKVYKSVPDLLLYNLHSEKCIAIIEVYIYIYINIFITSPVGIWFACICI